MNRNRQLFGSSCLLVTLAMGFSNALAAQDLRKEKPQAIIMLGQSNMVGVANDAFATAIVAMMETSVSPTLSTTPQGDARTGDCNYGRRSGQDQE